jgi:hypothetical protein
MVQNSRPPQDCCSPQRQSEGVAKSVRDGDSTREAALRTSAPAPASTATWVRVEPAPMRLKEVLCGTTSRLEIDIDPDLYKAMIKILIGRIPGK